MARGARRGRRARRPRARAASCSDAVVHEARRSGVRRLARLDRRRTSTRSRRTTRSRSRATRSSSTAALAHPLERDGDGAAAPTRSPRSSAATSPATSRPRRSTRSASTTSGARRPRTTAATSSTSRATPRPASTRARSSRAGSPRSSCAASARRSTASGLSLLPAPVADAGLLAVPDRVDGPRAADGDLPGALHEVPARPRHRRHERPQGVGVHGRRRDGRARVAGRDLAGRARAPRQPRLRRQLQPAAPRRPGARQRQDHPGARDGLPRRRLERHQGRSGAARWDPLLAADRDGLLVRRMEEAVDGEYQTYKARDGAFVREHFFGTLPGAARAGRATCPTRRSGRSTAAATTRRRSTPPTPRPSQHTGQPTVILAKTIKGYGMGEAGEGQNITHQQKKMTEDALLAFRDRFDLASPTRRSREAAFLQAGRRQPRDALPARAPRGARRPAAAAPAHGRAARGAAAGGVRGPARGHRRARDLDDDGVRAHPRRAAARQADRPARRADRARRVAHVRHGGDVPPARDLLPGRPALPARGRDQLMFYKEDKKGQILQEGINEPGAISSWIAAATSYANHGVPMMPFYIYYSMFGFQRVGDLAWAAGDMPRARLPDRRHRGAHDAQRRGPAARGRPQPRARLDDPELRLLRPDLRLRARGDHPGRPAADGRRAGGRLLLPHPDERELPAPGAAGGRRGGDPRGHVPAARPAAEGAPARAAAGLGHDPARGDGRRGAAARGLRRRRRRLERHQLHRAAPRRAWRPSAGTCCTRPRSRGARTSSSAWPTPAGPVVAATDYMRAFADQIRPFVPAPLQGARHRRLRPQRLPRRRCGASSRSTATTSPSPRSRRWPTTARSSRPRSSAGDREVRHRPRAPARRRLVSRSGHGDRRDQDVDVPDIGDFTDVPIIEMLVAPGDAVAAEDPLVTLESDKATMDVPGAVRRASCRSCSVERRRHGLRGLAAARSTDAGAGGPERRRPRSPQADARRRQEAAAPRRPTPAIAPATEAAAERPADGDDATRQAAAPARAAPTRAPPPGGAPRLREPGACAASRASSASTSPRCRAAGRKGRITKEDVERGQAGAAPAAAPRQAAAPAADGAGPGPARRGRRSTSRSSARSSASRSRASRRSAARRCTATG